MNTTKRVVFIPATHSTHKTHSFSSHGRSASLRDRDYYPRTRTSTSTVSTVRFLKRVGSKVARALNFVSGGKKWSGKVSASSAGLPRSWSYAESSTLDSQRAEAIEDCIEFLNYSSSCSSSLQRSFSATSCSSLGRTEM